MSLTLYYSPTSPFARKVRIAIAELGLQPELQAIALNPFEAGEDYWAVNPLSKVPTLLTRDGFVLPDSRLILDYLRTLGTALNGAGADSWPDRRRQQYADGALEAAVVANLEQRREAGLISRPWFDRQVAAIARTLGLLESEAAELRVQGGITLTEISLVSLLGYLDLRLSAALDWRAQAPALAQWFAAIAARESVAATVPPA